MIRQYSKQSPHTKYNNFSTSVCSQVTNTIGSKYRESSFKNYGNVQEYLRSLQECSSVDNNDNNESGENSWLYGIVPNIQIQNNKAIDKNFYEISLTDGDQKSKENNREAFKKNRKMQYFQEEKSARNYCDSFDKKKCEFQPRKNYNRYENKYQNKSHNQDSYKIQSKELTKAQSKQLSRIQSTQLPKQPSRRYPSVLNNLSQVNSLEFTNLQNNDPYARKNQNNPSFQCHGYKEPSYSSIDAKIANYKRQSGPYFQQQSCKMQSYDKNFFHIQKNYERQLEQDKDDSREAVGKIKRKNKIIATADVSPKTNLEHYDYLNSQYENAKIKDKKVIQGQIRNSATKEDNYYLNKYQWDDKNKRQQKGSIINGINDKSKSRWQWQDSKKKYRSNTKYDTKNDAKYSGEKQKNDPKFNKYESVGYQRKYGSNYKHENHEILQKQDIKMDEMASKLNQVLNNITSKSKKISSQPYGHNYNKQTDKEEFDGFTKNRRGQSLALQPTKIEASKFSPNIKQKSRFADRQNCELQSKERKIARSFNQDSQYSPVIPNMNSYEYRNHREVKYSLLEQKNTQKKNEINDNIMRKSQRDKRYQQYSQEPQVSKFNQQCTENKLQGYYGDIKSISKSESYMEYLQKVEAQKYSNSALYRYSAFSIDKPQRYKQEQKKSYDKNYVDQNSKKKKSQQKNMRKEQQLQHMKKSLGRHIPKEIIIEESSSQFGSSLSEDTIMASSHSPASLQPLLFEKLFLRLDSQGLGYLSKTNCQVNSIKEEIKYLLGSVFTNIKYASKQISLQIFIKQCQNECKKMGQSEKYQLVSLLSSLETHNKQKSKNHQSQIVYFQPYNKEKNEYKIKINQVKINKSESQPKIKVEDSLRFQIRQIEDSHVYNAQKGDNYSLNQQKEDEYIKSGRSSKRSSEVSQVVKKYDFSNEGEYNNSSNMVHWEPSRNNNGKNKIEQQDIFQQSSYQDKEVTSRKNFDEMCQNLNQKLNRYIKTIDPVLNTYQNSKTSSVQKTEKKFQQKDEEFSRKKNPPIYSASKNDHRQKFIDQNNEIKHPKIPLDFAQLSKHYWETRRVSI